METGKVKLITIIIFCMLSCAPIFACACSPMLSVKDESVRVTLIQSDFYDADGEYSMSVIRGRGISFNVVPRSGYFVCGTSYEGARITYGVNGKTRIYLPAVAYSVRVSLDIKEDARVSVRYDANGGIYKNTQSAYEERTELNGHLRPNTSTGTSEIYRDGYTLIGWNTKPDGSGKSYGLGSRCDLDDSGEIVLYAQWAEWTPFESFVFFRVSNVYRITGYTGSERVICVPAEYNGLTVKHINGGAFKNANAETVILPDSIETLEAGAFTDCNLREIYFYDNIVNIGDGSFVNCGSLTTVHINAALKPRFAAFDRHSNYADKIDILSNFSDCKKIVVTGGSGSYFSVNSRLIEEAFGGEYKVVNTALNGWFNAFAQNDIILNYLGEGDILLHLPEFCSPYQLLSKNNFAPETEDGFDDRFMNAFEENYDMLALADIRNCKGFFDSFSRFNSGRLEKEEGSYSDNANFIDTYGDYLGEKTPYGKDEALSGEAEIHNEYLTEEGLDNLNSFYTKVKSKGASAYILYPAVNVHGLIYNDEINGTNYLNLAAQFQTTLEDGIYAASVLGDIYSSFYDGSLFFNSDWHLSDEASAKFTETVIGNLKNALGGDDKR